jgi:hypothetical protein
VDPAESPESKNDVQQATAVTELTRNPPQHRLAGGLMLVMIVTSVLGGAGLSDFLWVSGLSALASLILLWDRARAVQQIQCAIFFGIGFICLLIAWLQGYRELPIKQLLTQNHLLISLLCAVSFLRLITQTRDKRAKSTGNGTRAFWQTLIGVHLFSSVINLSAFIIFADALKKGLTLDRTTATSVQRSFALAALWSPFFASMGTCLLYAPGARWADLLFFSLPLCAVGFLLTWAEHRFRLQGGLNDFEGYPVNVRAFWVPSLMMICVLIAHEALPEVSVLVLVSALAVLVPTLVLSVQRSLVTALLTVRDFSLNRLPDTYGELLLFFSTGVMATGISVLMLKNPFALGVSTFTPEVAIGLMAVLLFFALIGVHAIVTIVAASAVVAPLDPDPLMLALVFVVTWSVGSTGGPISGLNLAMQGRYGITAYQCFAWNLRYTLGMFAATSIWILLRFS